MTNSLLCAHKFIRLPYNCCLTYFSYWDMLLEIHCVAYVIATIVNDQ